jgi:hypothetical protein
MTSRFVFHFIGEWFINREKARADVVSLNEMADSGSCSSGNLEEWY